MTERGPPDGRGLEVGEYRTAYRRVNNVCSMSQDIPTLTIARPASTAFAAPWVEFADTRTRPTAARLATAATRMSASVDARVGSARPARSCLYESAGAHAVAVLRPSGGSVAQVQLHNAMPFEVAQVALRCCAADADLL